ncbi:NlpC/P60 family protein [Nocardioides immobilis]|uniref:NlpC/P60 family protein n=1 Tax=Nocardioides immobilis TaxID=2049295 RepID=A0A417Y281_9ACTN|nr:C40 family peptidase [Nocardioides immobilis]RHW26681.1 NlpC/P60 family protein [Nocardioides immobilis]
MRRPVIGTLLLAVVLVTAPASADPSDPDAPSHGDVENAERRAEGAADDVEGIQAQIDAANANLEAAAVAAQQAAEAYNGARWRLTEARKAERQATRESRRAARELATVKHDYRDAVLTTFVGGSPDLAEFNAMLDADGLSSLLDRDATASIVQGEFEEKRTAYETAAGEAEDAEQAAEDAAADAADAAEDAWTAKEDAESAVSAAAAAAESVSAEKARLLRRLAHLEGISVALAEERQAALEQQRQEQAALEARQQQEQQEQAEDPPPADDTEPTEPIEPTEPTEPDDSDPAPPTDTGGASAAVAFARAQLGEPYVWAAAGPDAWDCSGLTMGAWSAGGKSLPHYSVAQYEQSTPIAAGDLQPGDLVFWGSSSSASSIYHVALYAGDGTIIHALRTGRPVTEESIFYWIPPTHYARP